MPIILKEDEGKLLGKRQVTVPNKIVDKLKLNRNLFAGYKTAKGYKRINSIVDDDYNKRSSKKDKIYNGDKTVSFSDLKRIDHDLRHTNPNPHNLDYVLQAPLKQWANDELKKLRTSVKKVKAVPPVPKLQKSQLSMPKASNKELKMGNANVKLTEGYDDDWHPYYDALIQPSQILYDFIYSKSKKQSWNLIDPIPYKRALQEFIQYGQFIRFPEKYVYDWMQIIMDNTAKLRANGEWLGKETYYPFDDFMEVYEDKPSFFKKAVKKYGEPNEDNVYDILDFIGFYDWMELPDGSIGGSDFGTPKLEKIISEYKEGMTPEQTIVIINKALDVVHCQGDLPSAFIVGGSKTLSSISESSKKKKKIIFNENQLIALKEYHSQQVFNFDDNGDAYFKKNNYEHYIDFLEEIGTYGTLPKSKWTEQNINNAIQNSKEKISDNDDLDEYDRQEAFNEVLCKAFVIDREPDVYFNYDFVSLFKENDYESFRRRNHYYDECDVIKSFFEEYISLDIDELENCLTYQGKEEYQKELQEQFTNKFDEYSLDYNMQLNDRGLIYMERTITIPKFNTPDFNRNFKNDNFFRNLMKSYDGIGNCFTWQEGNGEAYCGNSFDVGSSIITLKCWVDPKYVNWDETVYRNCWSLNYEKEIYIDDYKALIEIFDVVLERGDVNGIDVSGKSLLKRPILVHP